MVEVVIDYKGELHCEAQHGPSEATIETDAPLDNQGRGESFSPTDLVATALGTCMATIMGIAARQEGVDLTGLLVRVRKEMSPNLPRRICGMVVEIVMPMSENAPGSSVLQEAALGCPVNHSIHPEIEVNVTWKWQ